MRSDKANSVISVDVHSFGRFVLNRKKEKNKPWTKLLHQFSPICLNRFCYLFRLYFCYSPNEPIDASINVFFPCQCATMSSPFIWASIHFSVVQALRKISPAALAWKNSLAKIEKKTSDEHRQMIHRSVLSAKIFVGHENYASLDGVSFTTNLFAIFFTILSQAFGSCAFLIFFSFHPTPAQSTSPFLSAALLHFNEVIDTCAGIYI